MHTRGAKEAWGGRGLVARRGVQGLAARGRRGRERAREPIFGAHARRRPPKAGGRYALHDAVELTLLRGCTAVAELKVREGEINTTFASEISRKLFFRPESCSVTKIGLRTVSLRTL